MKKSDFVKMAIKQKSHKGGDVVKEEMTESDHKGWSRERVVKETFGSEKKAKEITNILKTKKRR